jgi:hypothetical protein
VEAGSSLKVPITAAILNCFLLAMDVVGWIITFRGWGYIWGGPWEFVHNLLFICEIIGGITLLWFLFLKNIVAVKKLIICVLLAKFIMYPISFAFWLILGKDKSIESFINFGAQIFLGLLPQVEIYFSTYFFMKLLNYLVAFLLLYYLFKKPKRSEPRISNRRGLIPIPKISSSLAQELEHLQKLYQSGALTEAEFTAAKKRVLGN